MNSNELRIGNIITSGQIELLELRSNSIVCIRCDTGRIVSNPQPEPLTDEWFEKFGFEYHNENGSKWFTKYPTDPYNDVNVSCERGEPYYLLFTNDEGDMVQRYIELKYVHQLQNLYFTLTGEEL